MSITAIVTRADKYWNRSEKFLARGRFCRLATLRSENCCRRSVSVRSRPCHFMAMSAFIASCYRVLSRRRNIFAKCRRLREIIICQLNNSTAVPFHFESYFRFGLFLRVIFQFHLMQKLYKSVSYLFGLTANFGSINLRIKEM